MDQDKPHKKKIHNQEFKPGISKKINISTGGFVLAVIALVIIFLLLRCTHMDTFLITAIIALLGIIIDLFTNTFTYFLTLIQSIPFIGPIIANIITWPIFITLNVVAYFVSLLVIRFKGISMVMNARVITTIFLIGLLLGFILGRLF